MTRIHTDLVIHGTTHADANVAADALGVCAMTIRAHARAGTLHRVGLGLSGVEPMRVCIRGRMFDSPADAAAHFGVDIGQVYRRLAAGDPDSIGKPNDRGQHKAKSVTFGPLTFRSYAQASRELGFSSGYVGRAFERNSKTMKERILAAAMRLAVSGKNGVGA